MSRRPGPKKLWGWERQVVPEVVEFAVGPACRSVVAFAAEHVDVTKRVWCPMSRASAPAHRVIYVAELEEVVTPRLIDVYRSLPPDPLVGAAVQFKFPNVVQEAGWLCAIGTVSKASEKE